jgi:hypothetical protein
VAEDLPSEECEQHVAWSFATRLLACKRYLGRFCPRRGVVGIFGTVTCGHRQAYVPEGVYVDVRILQSSSFLVTSRGIVLLISRSWSARRSFHIDVLLHGLLATSSYRILPVLRLLPYSLPKSWFTDSWGHDCTSARAPDAQRDWIHFKGTACISA